MLLFNKQINNLVNKVESSDNWNVDNLANKYIDVIENNVESHNSNIFLVLAELPALVSILKRFTIYIVIGLISFNCLYISLSEILGNNLVGILNLYLNTTNLNDFFFQSGVSISKFSLTFSIIYLKFLLISHLLLNILLFSFYYLNSFLLLQKYNSVNKFRGNDLIPDTLDFEHDGLQRVMWKI